tara:strand:- start:442 stop:936 length:495 start_codon:yes stop_codon:yes gene_type:complete
MPEDITNMKTDVALIKKDIKQIGRFFDKVDNAVDSMAGIQQALAVQHQIITNFNDKLDAVESRVEENKRLDEQRSAVLGDRMEVYRKSSKEDHQRIHDQNQLHRKERNEEIIKELRHIDSKVDKRLTVIETKLATVERWKYYMMGISAAIIFIISKLDLKSFIG